MSFWHEAANTFVWCSIIASGCFLAYMLILGVKIWRQKREQNSRRIKNSDLNAYKITPRIPRER